MSTTNQGTGGLCREVEDSLAQVLDGTAPASLFDHVADCDHCRDLKHDAQRASEMVASAGADFRPPADFVEALVGRLDTTLLERDRSSGPRPAGSSTSTPSGVGSAAPRQTRGQTIVSPTEPEGISDQVSRSASSLATPLATLAADPRAPMTIAVDDDRVHDPIATAPTTFAPIQRAREEGEPDTTRDPIQVLKSVEPTLAMPAFEPIQPLAGPTVPAEPAVVAGAARPGQLRTDPLPFSASSKEKSKPASAEQVSSGSGAVAATTDHGERAPSAVPATAAAAPAKTAPGKTSAGAKVVPFLRKRTTVIAGALIAASAAAAAGFALKGRFGGPEGATATSDGPWSGTVASISRASADKSGGLEACDASRCWALADTANVKPGMTLKTDSRTRAHLTLGDGTNLALDRGTEVSLGAGKWRKVKVERGTLVADVAKIEGGHPAKVELPGGGEVEILGTKIAVTADTDRAIVEVARGNVRVKDAAGKWAEVRAGEEATMVRGAETVVASSTSLADVLEWSDRSQEEVDSPVLRGLGELRARKPGQTQEKERAVRLSKHSVKVRVVDVVARTEVDETFTNDTDEELEGIFRFPLPPGAQIENLALEVDGKLLDGAFVDRDRGAAIWRGVIQNAAPKAPKPREEIVWVPGPWRDPALLEWQRGGRFELRIFPIPKRGSRRVVLTYTQMVEQAGGIRRFTYPLAHDPSGTTKIDSFDVDVQVLGHDKELGVKSRGYELTSAAGGESGSGERRVMHADQFVPAGDLTLEYALPDRNKEITAWAYKMDPWATATTPASAVSKAKTPEEKAAFEAAHAIASDASPYVAIALRPKLPRWQEAKERVHAIVVDTSRSMIGERYSRATRLASSLVREMDRRDSFVLLACDTTCKPMSSDGSSRVAPSVPGATAAGEVEKFLGSIEPDGGSDIAASMNAARAAVGSLGGKELRVLYLGDGTPTVGPTRQNHLESAVRTALPGSDAAVIAVALGADADTQSLAALARGGGGVVVPYVPGQKVSTAAVDVLAAAYGVVLRDVEVELPSGLAQVTPARVDPIRSGGETFVVARMTGNDVNGTVKVRGRVGGERFEQAYPMQVAATTNAGNAFVPRLYAAAKIAELEAQGGESIKPTVVELSRKFAVASRFTSLIVLESEAMFKAFGLERGSVAPSFTGEQSAQSTSADAEGDAKEDQAQAELGTEAAKSADKAFDDRDSAGFPGGGSAGHGRSAGPMAQPAPASPSFDAPAEEKREGESKPKPKANSEPMAPPMSTTTPPAKKPAQIAGADPLDPFSGDMARRRPPPRPPRRMIPMRRVFDRKASFENANTLAQQALPKLVVAESAARTSPDSRDKTVELFQLLSTSGRVGEAQELTARWAGRDALDPDALLARADLWARQGDRERAVRVLGGLTDVRPGDKQAQLRLAELHEATQNLALACQHRITLAELSPGDAKSVADAVRCARTQGLVDLAALIKTDASPKIREAVEKQLAAAPTSTATGTLRGDVQITADWTGGGDLDIALIDSQGRRISWLGSPTKSVGVTVRDATNPRTEALALSNLPSGSYLLEISRASGGDANDVVRGDVTIKMPGGESRKVPFSMNGARAEVGTVRVFFTSRLVPIEGGWGF